MSCMAESSDSVCPIVPISSLTTGPTPLCGKTALRHRRLSRCWLHTAGLSQATQLTSFQHLEILENTQVKTADNACIKWTRVQLYSVYCKTYTCKKVVSVFNNGTSDKRVASAKPTVHTSASPQHYYSSSTDSATTPPIPLPSCSGLTSKGALLVAGRPVHVARATDAVGTTNAQTL